MLLARELLDRYAADPAEPVPLILHLGSWRPAAGALDDWLAAEMNLRYRLPVAMARELLRDGRLLPFARGGFLVALKTGLPILPIGLEGPRLVLPPGEGVIRPGPLTVRLGGPIPTAGLGISQLAGLMARVRTEIDRLRGSDGHLPDADS